MRFALRSLSLSIFRRADRIRMLTQGQHADMPTSRHRQHLTFTNTFSFVLLSIGVVMYYTKDNRV